MNFKLVSIYLKTLIRIRSLFTRLRPKDLQVRIRWQPQYHEDHIFALLIRIWFKIDGRSFGVALPMDRKFSYINEIPKSFLRAYERAQYRVENE